MPKPLRPYQAQAIQEARQKLRAGKRAVLLVAPTGAGKTRCGVEIVIGAIARGGRVLWMAHRSELIDQAVSSVISEGLLPEQVTTLRSGRRGYVPIRPVCVASTQTMIGVIESADAVAALAPTVIVLDEAHHYVADEWGRIAAAFPRAIIVGLTATPERGDGAPLGDVFDSIVVVSSVRELTELGVLVPCRIVHPESAMGKRKVAAAPIDAYRELADGTQAIVFAVDVPTAQRWAVEFEDAGVRAACVDGKVPRARRDEMIASFRAGEIRVLTNVNVLTEGFDAPSVETCILGQRCGHVGRYLQIVGRILRAAPGKTSALLIDLCGAAAKHGRPSDEHSYSLDGEHGIVVRAPDVAAKQCATCGACFRAGPPICPQCGAPTRKDMPDVMVDPTRLVEFVPATKEEKQRWFDEWTRTQRAQGYQDGWVAHQYRRRFGVWPRGMKDTPTPTADGTMEVTCPDCRVPRQVNRNAFYKSRARGSDNACRACINRRSTGKTYARREGPSPNATSSPPSASP